MSTSRTSTKSGLSPWIGWGISTLALLFLNKKKSSVPAAAPDPSSLHAKGTKLGEVIPVVMGTCLIKQPLTTYWGGFNWKLYTEEYGAHSSINVGGILASTLLAIVGAIMTPDVVHSTGTSSHGGPVVTEGTDGGTSGQKRNMIILAVVSALIQLLMAMLGKHGSRTTIQKGFKYYVGWQQIICWAHKNARLKRVYMAEEVVWEGDEPASNHTDGSYFNIHIDDENLFGGPDEGGGFVGDIHFYFGGEKQTGDPWMKSQMTADSIDASLRGYTPAYRPFISVVIPTAYIGKRANIPELWFEIEIIPTDLGVDEPKLGDDANPAEILHEIVVNNDWGLAERGATLSLEALKEMGEVLAKEKLGLSVLLDSKQEARELTNDICSHINAIRFSEMPTGRIVYRLIRGDYDESKVLTVTESNCMSMGFTRQDWTNTVSEISVSYTDRQNVYETGTLSADDPANIEIQNGVKTVKSYDMPYFTTAENALWFAQREGKSQGYPLAVFNMKCNRQMYSVRLGDVLRINFPPYGIDSMLVRVTNINLNTLEDGVIEIDALEDVFALGKTSYGFISGTEWQEEKHYPTGVQNFKYFEAPYELLKMADTYVFAMASKPDIYTDVWTVWRKRAGATTFVTTTSSTKWTAIGQLVWDLDKYGPAEDMTGIELMDLFGLDEVKNSILMGGYSASIATARTGTHIILVGDEVIAFSSMTLLPNGHWQLGGILRGVYDTIPHQHGNGDLVYFLLPSNYCNVTTGGPVCPAGSVATEQYNITTASGGVVEDFNLTKVKTLTTTRRAERPTPPGKFRMECHLVPPSVKIDRVAGDLSLTWVPRDKHATVGIVSQDDENEYYTGLPYTTPTGMDYYVEIWVDGERKRQTVLSAESIVITWEERCLASSKLTAETEIRLYNMLAGLESHQYHERTFMWVIPQVVGFAKDEVEAGKLIASLDKGGTIVIPPTGYNNPLYVEYADAPIVIIGTPATTPSVGDMINTDGTYWTPTGSYVVFDNDLFGTKRTFDNGYTFMTRFYEPSVMVETRYYRWNGTIFDEVKIDE